MHTQSAEIVTKLRSRMLLGNLSALVAALLAGIAIWLTVGALHSNVSRLDVAGRHHFLGQQLLTAVDQLAKADQPVERAAAADALRQVVARLTTDGAILQADASVPAVVAAHYRTLWQDDAGLLARLTAQAEAMSYGGPPPDADHRAVMAGLEQGLDLYAQWLHTEIGYLRLVALLVLAVIVILGVIMVLAVHIPGLRIARRQIEALAFHSRALEQSGAQVVFTDPAGIITYANRGAVAISGWTREELVGQHTRVFCSGQTAPEVYADLWQTVQSGKAWNGELCNRRKDGSLTWVNATISPVYGERGDLLGYLSIEHDVSALRALISENAEVRDQLATAIEAIDDGFALFNAEGHLVLWNSRVQSMFQGIQDRIYPGVTYRELLEAGVERGLFGPFEPGQRQTFIERRLALFQQGKHDTEFAMSNGQWMLASDRRTADGGTVLLRVDITERKQTEVALREAKAQADAANRAKSAFLSSMSHELRTPLNAILGFAQMLSCIPGEPLGNQQERCARYILKGGEHLLNLINEVLDLAKIEAGRVDISMETIDLGGLVDECLSLVAETAAQSQITLAPFTAPVPPLQVRADRIRTKQVLLNLLSNAIKYNRRHGTVTVTVRAYPGGRVRLEVADTGIGIPAAKQDAVFAPFNRLGAETTEIEGTGIGLSITRELVRLMGGDIAFTSIEGQGTTFSVDLLNAVEEGCAAAGAAQSDPAIPHSLARLGNAASGEGGTVLCIEDNPANIALMEMIAGAVPGLRLVTANSGEEGLRLAEDCHPDLVLMDINLPGIDGFEALNQLRRRSEFDHVPVVALTANATDRMVERGLAAGFARVLIKPIVVDQVLGSIHEFVKEKAA